MEILKEGTITITADSELLVEGFTVKDGTLRDLEQLAVARGEVALERAKRSLLVSNPGGLWQRRGSRASRRIK